METAQHHQAEYSPLSQPTSQPGISGSFHPPQAWSRPHWLISGQFSAAVWESRDRR